MEYKKCIPFFKILKRSITSLSIHNNLTEWALKNLQRVYDLKLDKYSSFYSS